MALLHNTNSSNQKRDGYTAKIARNRCSTFDILYNFYHLNLSDQQKIERAIEKDLVIPREFVPIARRLYDEGKLGCHDKQYQVSSIFEDPEMQPLKTHPQFEQNPKYPREYPRRIQKSRKRQQNIQEENIEDIGCRKWRETLCPEFMLWWKRRKIVKRRFPLPKKRPRSPLPIFTPEELQKKHDYPLEHSNVMVEKRSIRFDVRSENELQFVRYEDMKDFPEMIEPNFLEVNIQMEVRGRAARLNEEEELNKKKQFLKTFSQNLTGSFGLFVGIRHKRLRKITEKENLGIIEPSFNVLKTRQFYERLEAEKERQQELEELAKIEPLATGEDADRELMKQFNLETNLSGLSADSDDDQQLRIVSSDEESSSCSDGENEVEEQSTTINENATFGDTDDEVLIFTKKGTDDSMSIDSIPLQVNVQNEKTKEFGNEVSQAVKRKPYNPWADILSDAEEIFVRQSSAPHSMVSSASSFHDESSKDKCKSGGDDVSKSGDDESGALSEATPGYWKMKLIKQKKPRGRPRKRTRASMELMRKTQAKRFELRPAEMEPLSSGVLDPSVVTKRTRGRPRKRPMQVVSTEYLKKNVDLIDFKNSGHRRHFESSQPDIVVESSIPAPQPHQFPRPDLEPFVASSHYPTSGISRTDCERFMAQRTRASSHPCTLKSTEGDPKFVHPDLNRLMVDYLPTKERASSETLSVTSIYSETDEPKRAKRRKSVNRLTEDNDDDMSSTSSIHTPSSRLRPKRSYLSKNNPTIRQTSFAESEESVSRASSVSGIAVNRTTGGLASRTSSLFGDAEDMILLPKSKGSVEEQQFQDPLPPPEVVIDEEAESKPDVNDLPTPPPINSTSRRSIKRDRIRRVEESEIKIEDVEEENIEVVFSEVVNVKDEDDVLLVDATYKVPRNNPTPVVEQDVLPPKPKTVSKEKLTHEYAVNKFMYDGLNELFTADPAQFSSLVLCILKDEKCEGTTFKVSCEITDRKSKFSDELIKYISTSAKDGIYPNSDMKRYSNFTGEFRKKCTLPEVLRDGLTPMNFFQIVERIIEVNQCLKNNLPSEVVTLAERECLSTVENIMIGRFVESTFKLASLSSIEWATKAHMRRRFELLLNGWKEFLRKGGFLRVILAIDRDDMKPVNEGFKTRCKEILDECELNVQKASELLDLSEEELAERMAAECEVSKEEFEKATKDMRKAPSETHTKQCIRCKNYDLPIFFSSDETFDIHSRLHGSSDCNLCYEDCPNATGIIIHGINSHYSILRDYS